jgi:hypothetical protein
VGIFFAIINFIVTSSRDYVFVILSDNEGSSAIKMFATLQGEEDSSLCSE